MDASAAAVWMSVPRPGGFTDCLLRRGAAHVAALDVAYGELRWALRSDQRVTVLERPNARYLEAAMLPQRARPRRDRRLVHLAREGAAGRDRVLRGAPRRLAIVKPQFEVGRGRVGKGGVVRAPAAGRSALAEAAPPRGSSGA